MSISLSLRRRGSDAIASRMMQLFLLDKSGVARGGRDFTEWQNAQQGEIKISNFLQSTDFKRLSLVRLHSKKDCGSLNS